MIRSSKQLDWRWSLVPFALTAAIACQPTDTADMEADDTGEIAASESEVPGTEAGGDVGAVEAQMWLDDFTLGRGTAADSSIPMDQQGDDFAPGESVYLAMEVGDAPAGAEVRVVAFDGADREVGQAQQAVVPGARYMAIEIPTTGWALGDYRLEVWVGDERVNEQHFQIVEPGDAGT